MLLDHSTAFDMDINDLGILLPMLLSLSGLSRKAYDWFFSYVQGINQSLLSNLILSIFWALVFAVSQGSVVSPLLYIINTSPLGELLKSFGLHHDLCTSDIQLYVIFDTAYGANWCSWKDRRSWLYTRSFQCLTNDKTEVVIGLHSSLTTLTISPLSIEDEDVAPASLTRLITFMFDQYMNHQQQISATRVTNLDWFHLRYIAMIR